MHKPYFLNSDFNQVVWWPAWFNMQLNTFCWAMERVVELPVMLSFPIFISLLEAVLWKLKVQLNLLMLLHLMLLEQT